MAGYGGGEAFPGEFAFARAGDPDHGEGAETAQDVDGSGAAGIEEAGAEGEVDAQLGEPAAAPDPMGEEREDEGGEDGSRGRTRGEPPAVRTRAPGNEHGEGYGEELKEHGELRTGRGSAETAQQQGACASPVPRLSGELEDVRGGTVGEGGADQREGNDGNGHHDQAAEQRLRRRTGAAQAGVDEGHAGNGKRRKQQEAQGEGERGFREGQRRGRGHGRFSSSTPRANTGA